MGNNPIPEITESKASSLRKYFFEYVVIALCVAVVTLFGIYYNMNQFMLKTYDQTVNRATNAIERNNELIQQNKH